VQHSCVPDICPSAAKNSHVYVRALHDACVALGGEHKLAEYLGVEVTLINDWLNGVRRPPDAVFLRCADLLHARRYGPD
jgi:transcriptional regulator with XRE-family HTH domain